MACFEKNPHLEEKAILVVVDYSSNKQRPGGVHCRDEARHPHHWFLFTNWAAFRSWVNFWRKSLLESLVDNLEKNLLAMVELCPMAPVRQTHLGTWVGKRYGQGTGCRAPGC